MYVNISIHDYLRALMGFHQFDTNFTLDPRISVNENNKRDSVSRGIGNQVTTEFNLLYRFHCAISKSDEDYLEAYMKKLFSPLFPDKKDWDPKTLTLKDYMYSKELAKKRAEFEAAHPSANPTKKEVWEISFGIEDDPEFGFTRDPITNLFNDQKMINQLLKSMDDPICKCSHFFGDVPFH